MTCPRCKKSHSKDLKFYFKQDKITLEAHTCQVCGYLWAEDEKLLRAARKHLYAATRDHEKQSPTDK